MSTAARRKQVRISSIDPQPEIVFVRKGLLPYDDLQKDLERGRWPTVDGITKQAAYKAARILSRRMKAEVRQSVYSKE